MENSATKLKNENNPPEKVMDRFTRFQNERTLSDRQYRVLVTFPDVKFISNKFSVNVLFWFSHRMSDCQSAS